MLKKYQDGSEVIDSNDEFTTDSLSNNQQKVIEPNSVDDLFDKLGEKSDDSTSTSTNNLDDLFNQLGEEPKTAFDTKQDILSQVGGLRQDILKGKENITTTPQESLIVSIREQQKWADEHNRKVEERANDLKSLSKIVDIPKNIKQEDIQIETLYDLPTGSAHAQDSFTPPTPTKSNVKKATFPDGKVYIFTDEGSVRSVVGELAEQVGAKALIKGTTGFLELLSNGIYTLSGAEFMLKSPPLREAADYINKKINQAFPSNELTPTEEVNKDAQGFFFTPFTDRVEKSFDQLALKIVPDKEYLANDKAFQDKVEKGDVKRLLTDPLFWNKVLSDEFLFEQGLPGLETAAEFYVPGAAVAKAGAVTKLMKEAGVLAKTNRVKGIYELIGGVGDGLTGSFVATAQESHMEGANNAEGIAVAKYNKSLGEDEQDLKINTLRELVKSPDSQKKIDALEVYKESYKNMFNANFLPLLALNTLPIMTLAGKGASKMIRGTEATTRGIMGKLGTVARAYPRTTGAVEFTIDALSDAEQEKFQSGLENYEKDKQVNGLYPLDNTTLEDIWGGEVRGWKDFNQDENTTISWLLGLGISSSMISPQVAMDTYKQIQSNKSIKALLSKYPTGNITSLSGMFKDGKVNMETLATKINALNSHVIHEEFQEKASKLKDKDLQDYSYQQAIGSLVYDAVNEGIDPETAKDHLRKLISSNYKSKMSEDVDGLTKKSSEIVNKKMTQVDELFDAAERTQELKQEYDLPEKHTQALFGAAAGALSLVAIAAMAGCHKHQQVDSDPAMGQTTSKAILETPGFDPKDPVTISAIRERALATIEESAKSPEAPIRANAVEAASLAPDRLKTIVDHALDDHNPGVRTVAAMAVGKAHLTKLAPRVRPLLTDPSPYVKSAAIYALAKCGFEVDRSPLAGMLLRDPSLRVRSHVAFILGELGDPSALPLLRESVRERTAGISPERFNLFELQVAEAMIKLGDREQCGVIQAALHPSHAEELEGIALAAQLIGEVQDGSAAAQLVSLADFTQISKGDPKHPSAKTERKYPPEIRLAAAGALSALGIKGTAAPTIADEYSTNPSAPIRAQAAYVYGQIGSMDQWGKLDALMGDSEASVRVAAAAAVLRSKPTAN